jgi:phosphomannomutase
MAGHTAPAVFDAIGSEQAEVVPMYFELDGTSPNHEANPIEPRTSATSRPGCVARGRDFGLAFDGDADRCFVVDEQGRASRRPTLTALIAARSCKEPGRDGDPQPDHQPRRAEIVASSAARPVRTRVGHSYIKADDGRDRRDLRRRAQRALLLP